MVALTSCINLTIRRFGSGGVLFSVRRVSQDAIILEIVYLLRKRQSCQNDEKTCRIIIWLARPLEDTLAIVDH